MTADAVASFPRRSARTRRFTLGRPRDLHVAPDGARVVYLRSGAGDDPVNRLWVLDPATGAERCVVDPTALDPGGGLPAEERARRERVREIGGGIVSYATDRATEHVVFTLSGRLLVAALDGSGTREMEVEGPVVDPRLSPDGASIAYVVGGRLHVVPAGGGDEIAVSPPSSEDVTWGLAEFVAAEEMGRSRGHWWSPEGDRLLVARADQGPVTRWHLADPARPASPPQEIAYPAAGTENADISLWLVHADGDGDPLEIRWDRAGSPYLARVAWNRGRPPTLLVQDRDQRRQRILVVDAATGATETVAEETEPRWVELVPGSPDWTPDGRLVTVADHEGARRVLVDGRSVSPDGVQVRAIVGVSDDAVLCTASEEDPTAVHVLRLPCDGRGEPERLTTASGVHDAVEGGGLVVTTRLTLEDEEVIVEVHGPDGSTRIASHHARSGMRCEPRILELGERRLRAALLLPVDAGPGLLPVLMDPYGGPHVQRVLRSRHGLLSSQWFAEQGFAVLVVDGRGTPGRGPEWERAVHGDIAGPVLEDQVDALHAAAEVESRLDLDRVGVRGWSFGGYLAALAVLRRPDVFHAAVAGAPVTDWRLYDTHYTERYLGHPEDEPQAYERTSLLVDARATNETRPLLLIHGLADDNVVAAHSLQLSRALLEAGRAHTFLPLSGVTHMTPQEVVAENLLVLQAAFLREALGAGA